MATMYGTYNNMDPNLYPNLKAGGSPWTGWTRLKAHNFGRKVDSTTYYTPKNDMETRKPMQSRFKRIY